MIDERAEGPRADVVAADQAQPIEPLLVGEPHPLVWFTHLSAPQSRTAPSIADAQDGHNQDCAKTQRLWR
jgi:hypothetical protein